jgi:hypothetical protein
VQQFASQIVILRGENEIPALDRDALQKAGRARRIADREPQIREEGGTPV